MASIPNLDLTDAMQVTTVAGASHEDGPDVLVSAGVVGAGAAVVIMCGLADALDITGQLASLGWRVVMSVHNAAAGADITGWVRT